MLAKRVWRRKGKREGYEPYFPGSPSTTSCACSFRVQVFFMNIVAEIRPTNNVCRLLHRYPILSYPILPYPILS